MFLSPKDLLGKTIKGRYRLQKILGQGSMGTVYLAQDLKSNRPLAVKILFPKESSEHDTSIYNTILKRFRNEGMLIATLRHKHIVRVYDMGDDQGLAYIVMEYLEKGTLRDLIQRQQGCSLMTTLAYVEQAASALDYIHRQGIVHRDIKPQNFLIGKDGQLILSDFGVAHIVGSTLTKTGEFWGTNAYASPELQSGQHAHPQDDIYSLGVMIYEMLTNNHPATVHQPHSNIPEKVDDVIKEAKDPQRVNRYSSAEDLCDALKDAIRSYDEKTEMWIGSSGGKLPSRWHRKAIIQYGFSSTSTPVQRFSSPNNATSGRKISLLIVIFTILLILLLTPLLFNDIFKNTKNSVLIPGPGDTTPTPMPISTPSQRNITEEARDVVLQYYDYWNEGKYQEAYDLLQADYQKEYSYEMLLPNYEQTKRVCITVDNMTSSADGTVQVAITNNAIEVLPSDNTEVINRYMLTFHVKKEKEVWKIAPHDLQTEPMQGVCPID